MTKVTKQNIKCANCGTESEQMIVYSINHALGNNEELANHQQICPNCNYTAPDISIKN